MKFNFLTQQFYTDYAHCTEIERKHTRPYAQVFIDVQGMQFAVPLRSGIKHKNHVLWTDRENQCGLDFSKAVLITNETYIDQQTKVHIRQKEFDALRGKEYIIKQKMLKHIADYFKAKQNQHIERNRLLCTFSTMQYFEAEIAQITNL